MSTNHNALVYAASTGDIEKLRECLLSQEREKGIYIEQRVLNQGLISACSSNSLDGVRLLIHSGAEVNFCSDYGRTPLSICCQSGHFDIVRFLTENGADVHNRGVFGDTALTVALSFNSDRVASYLIDKSDTGDLETIGRHSKTPLWWCAYNGQLDLAKKIVERGADINRGAPIVAAVSKNRVKVCEYLISMGANVNAQSDGGGPSPLIVAAQAGAIGVLKCLLSPKLHGRIDLNEFDMYGETALYISCHCGYRQSVDALLASGARVDRMCHGSSVLQCIWDKQVLSSVKMAFRSVSLCRALQATRRVRLLPIVSDHVVALIARQLFLLEHPIVQRVPWAIRVWSERCDWLFSDETEILGIASMVREMGVLIGFSKEQFLAQCALYDVAVHEYPPFVQ